MPRIFNVRFMKLSLCFTLCFPIMVINLHYGNEISKPTKTIILSYKKSENHNKTEFNNMETKYILYWTPFWHQRDYYIGFGFKPFERCEFKNCYATDNRTLLPLEKYDALMFHASTYSKEKDGVPWTRAPHQRYIFMNMEAPSHICPNLKQYASYFNWTMSYRIDSDIIRTHGFIEKSKYDYALPAVDYLQNKTKFAAWMVSNCNTPGKREVLAKELKKYVDVDIYGSCGPMKCKRFSKISPPECYEMIEKNYKFYFAFENSYCKWYATEKLYNSLKRNMVPVVYGMGDYDIMTPPHSVIDSNNFETVKELADYLKYLNENTEEYLKYFEWKKHYEIDVTLNYTACQMCKKLHDASEPPHIYHDLHEWWWGKNNSICRRKEELPKIVLPSQ